MADVWEPSFDDEEDSDNEIMNESTTSQSKIVNASSASVSQELEEGEISDDDSDESDAADDTSSNDQKKGKPAQINDDTNTDGKSKVSGGIASSQNQSGKGKEEEDCDMDIDHVSSSASSSDTQKDKKNANQNQNQGNNNTTTNGVEMAILREENQRLLALVSELTKKKNQAAASTDHTLPSTVLQRPLLQVDYQYLSTEARNALDLSFQRPALDRFAPPRRTTDAGMYYQKGNTGRKGSSNAVDAANKPFADRSIPNGRVQYFETFCIDMVGIRNMPDNLHQPTECDAFAIPIYEGPVNQVPFPDAAAEDLFRALGTCML